MTRFTRVALLSLALGCLLSTACAAPWSQGAPSPTDVANTPAPPVTATAAGTATVTPPPSGPQTITLPGTDPITLDPALSSDTTSAQYIILLYSGLVRFNRTMHITPDLATHWTVSSDGLIYTFHLRSGAVFANGDPITAADFVFAINRACNPALKSPVASTYLGDIRGVADRLDGRATSVSGLSAPSALMLRITLAAPQYSFLAKLSFPTAFALDPRTTGAGSLDGTQPNGSGPFVLASYTSGQTMVLNRNDRYYGQAPILSAITFNMAIANPQTAYDQGSIDLAAVGEDTIDRVSDPVNALSQQLHQQNTLSVTYLVFNEREAPFQDPLVRQAFSEAIDRSKIASVTFRGLATAAGGFLPPDLPGYTASVTGAAYDPAAAMATLARSSYGGAAKLPRITLYTVSGGEGLDPLTKALVGLFHDSLGVDVYVRAVDQNTFFQQIDTAGNPYGLYVESWSADYPDPQDFLQLLFASTAPLNTFGYHDAQFDALEESAAREASATRRFQLDDQAEAVLLRDAAVAPLFYGRDDLLVKPYVHGFVETALGQIDFRGMYVSQH